MASKIHWITILIVMLPACHEDSVNSKKQGSVANPSPASSQKENRIMKQNTSNPPERIVKSDEEWRKILTPDQYRVMREKGTEPAFTGAYWATKTPGIYLCAACGLDVFDSKSKFDSGTGWPSFGSRSPATTSARTAMNRWGWSASKCSAAVVTAILAMSSTTAPNRPACDTASTPLP